VVEPLSNLGNEHHFPTGHRFNLTPVLSPGQAAPLAPRESDAEEHRRDGLSHGDGLIHRGGAI
jgi:hypothetical protein